MGTTKLTRKEILGEDPVFDAILGSIEFFRLHGKAIGLGVGTLVLLGLGVYFGLQYLETRDLEVQQRLSRGIDFYHAQIDATALDDPFGKGIRPTFRTPDAKYKAALEEFSWVVNRNPRSKSGVIARFYTGLCHQKLGQTAESIKALEETRNNTVDMTIGYLAKKVLALRYMEQGNHKASIEILDGMIKDPQCPLPKEELKLQLAKVYIAQGKQQEGLQILRQARDESGASPLQMLLNQELSRLETASTAPGGPTQIVPIR